MAKKKKKSNVVDLNKVRNSKKKARFLKLAWEILGHKFLYYQGSEHGLKPVNDAVYDKIEDEYKKLAEELGEETTASDMVGFDSSRPSCKMVMEHLIARKGKFSSTGEDVKKETTKVKKRVGAYYETLLDVMEEIGVKENTAKKIRIRMKKRMKP